MLLATVDQKVIPPGANDPHLDVIEGVVLHVAVSTAPSLFNFFKHDGGIESHFYVRFDGTVEQYRDTDYEADAQALGNSWIASDGKRHGFLSIETEGMGPGKWTPHQIAAIKKLLLELAGHYGFPLRKCPGPYEAGVGYHRQFRAWNPDSHSCPGDGRIRQFHGELMPWFTTAKVPHRRHRRPRWNPANYYIGAHGPWVRWLGRRLVAHGFTKHGDKNGYQPGPTFTRYDRENVRDFQRAQGWTGSDADGFPGPETLKRLAAKPKPTAPAAPAPKHHRHKETRITRARDHFEAGLALLRDAETKQGRTGRVKKAADLIEKIVDHVLPKR